MWFVFSKKSIEVVSGIHRQLFESLIKSLENKEDLSLFAAKEIERESVKDSFSY